MANTTIYESARWVLPFGIMSSMLPQHCQFPIAGEDAGNGGASVATGGASSADASVAMGGSSCADASAGIGGANSVDASVGTGGSSTTPPWVSMCSSISSGAVSTGGSSSAGSFPTPAAEPLVARGVCGNAIVEPGETCDVGSKNGTANHCDLSCQFVCKGLCPLRVNPAAMSNGAGHNWSEPKNDIQDAINQQSAMGGEVWVLAGRFPSLTRSGRPGLSIPSHVHLRGGFAGTETSPHQRSATRRRAAMHGSGATMLDTSLTISNSTDVLVEAILAGAGGYYMQIQNSSVAYVDTSLEYREITVTASQVMFQRVVTSATMQMDAASNGLFIDSVFSGEGDGGPNLSLLGPAALVGSQVTTPGYGYAAISGGSLLVFNSSFNNLTSNAAHGEAPNVSVLNATSLEVSMSTFYNDQCTPQNGCVAAVTPGDINNSLFVHVAPVLSAGEPPISPSYYAVQNHTLPTSDCASYALDAFQAISSGGVLASPHPCPDGGDATLLESSRQHLFEFAAPFAVAPFNADLSRYCSPGWWQTETAVAGQSNDTGAPDPGAHFVM